MIRIDNGKWVLSDAEQALQQLLTEAATDGDDDTSFPNLAGWAQQVASLCGTSSRAIFFLRMA